MLEASDDIMPGSRVKVFDYWLYRDDRSTPISETVKPATVLCRYGERSRHSGYTYPDLVDVLFDHQPDRVSRGHFTYGVELIEGHQ